MVRSPTRTPRELPCMVKLLERNTMWGKASALKKSAERRWASRWASRVLMLAVAILASTTEAEGLVSSGWTLISNCSNEPRTLEIIMWRTENSMAVWA